MSYQASYTPIYGRSIMDHVLEAQMLEIQNKMLEAMQASLAKEMEKVFFLPEDNQSYYRKLKEW